MPGYEHLERPPAWAEDCGEVYCLACRRELAAEAGVDAAPSGTTVQRRAQIRTAALIEFEVGRDPKRSDTEIARAIRTSVPAVVKVRQRLELARAGGQQMGNTPPTNSRKSLDGSAGEDRLNDAGYGDQPQRAATPEPAS